MNTRTTAALALCALGALAGCGGDDSGDSTGSGGGGDGDGNAVSNDAGRSVEGCFDCADGEYCLIQAGETMANDVNSCVETTCADACECIIADAKKRLEVCQTLYSCQEGSGLMYCYQPDT